MFASFQTNSYTGGVRVNQPQDYQLGVTVVSGSQGADGEPQQRHVDDGREHDGHIQHLQQPLEPPGDEAGHLPADDREQLRYDGPAVPGLNLFHGVPGRRRRRRAGDLPLT